jgi:hypothetical protein
MIWYVNSIGMMGEPTADGRYMSLS